MVSPGWTEVESAAVGVTDDSAGFLTLAFRASKTLFRYHQETEVKVVQKNDEYTIYQRRDERYAVRNAARQWVNGDDKVAILVAAGLITVSAPAPKEEPAEEPAAEEAIEASADEGEADAEADSAEEGDDS